MGEFIRATVFFIKDGTGQEEEFDTLPDALTFKRFIEDVTGVTNVGMAVCYER